MMRRWQLLAPPDGRGGRIGLTPVANHQVTRQALLLAFLSRFDDDLLARLAQLARGRQGADYLSRDPDRLTNPYPISRGWHIEGCTNLGQKLGLLRLLRELGFSPDFVQAAQDFGANESVERYLPTPAELKTTPEQVDGRATRATSTLS
jgi:hypothetical protein